MENFTPVSSAAGGMMIGLAVMLLWLGLGGSPASAGSSAASLRILPFLGARRSRLGASAFLAGLLAAPLLLEFGRRTFGRIRLPDSDRPADPGGIAGRLWHAAWQRLHQRSWRLRHSPGCRRDPLVATGAVHGDCGRHRLPCPPC